MDLSIYNYKDYKTFLKAVLGPKSKWGAAARMAEAIGCQSSYLSQVLKSKPQLTPDQALLVTRHLHLDESATEYFLLLVDLARASSPLLKSRLEGKLKSLRTQQENLSERLKRPKVDANVGDIPYYSSWLWGAIHILVAIPEFQDVSKLALRLGISKEKTLSILESLAAKDLVREQGGKWLHGGGEIHLSNQSSLISLHHNNWRQRAVLDSQEGNSSSLHFSGVYSVSRQDIEALRQLVLEVIASVNRVAGPSSSEEAICFNCDLFQI